MAGEEEIFFWIKRQLAVLAVPAGYTDCNKDSPVDLLIWIDVTHTHTEQSFGRRYPPERDRIISAFHVKSALVKMQKLH